MVTGLDCGALSGARRRATLTARMAALEDAMPQIQAFDTTAEAVAFSHARPGNIGFSREV